MLFLPSAQWTEIEAGSGCPVHVGSPGKSLDADEAERRFFLLFPPKNLLCKAERPAGLCNNSIPHRFLEKTQWPHALTSLHLLKVLT